MDAKFLLMTIVASLFRNAVSVVFVPPFEGSIFVAVGKNAKFSLRFTGSFDQIDFGPSTEGTLTARAIRVAGGTPSTVQYHPSYQGRISWAGNANSSPVEVVFILSNVSQSDSSQYMCAVITNGLPTSRLMELTVTDANIVEHPESAICQTNGSEVTFTCNATGTPDPNVTWVRGEGEEEIVEGSSVKIVRDGKGYSELTIKNCGKGDVYDYRCKATNPPDVKVLSKPAILFFKYVANDPDEVDEQSSPSVVNGSIGEETTLRCAFTGYPPPYINWTLPNGNSKQTRLPFYVVTPMSSEQLGKYTCSADGFLPRTITLQVRDNRTITNLGPAPCVPVPLKRVDDAKFYIVTGTSEDQSSELFLAIGHEEEITLCWASVVKNIEDKKKKIQYLLEARVQTDASNYVTQRYNVTLMSKARSFQAGFLAIVPLVVCLLSAGFQ